MILVTDYSVPLRANMINLLFYKENPILEQFLILIIMSLSRLYFEIIKRTCV
jgi:hypothetical protein